MIHTAMRILACHNYYQQRGGEDESFEQEALLLESYGHTVDRFTVHNDTIKGMVQLSVATRTQWNHSTYTRLRQRIASFKPAIVHFTNTFPLISPAAYYAARRARVPVVQSLRNYRLLCANGYLMRDGKVCELCVARQVPWPAIVHRCYRDDRSASAAVAAMLTLHRAAGTWTRMVNMYYALTEFSRNKFIEGGLPAEKIAIKPNFVLPEPRIGTGKGGYALYVGRLSPEKGIQTLLQAWALLKAPIQLKIVGDGPEADVVRAAASKDPRITYLGQHSVSNVLELTGEAACLIIPSLWYEGFPRIIVEAYAKGTPVIGSRLGSVGELVIPGKTGWHFEAGNAEDLHATLLAAWYDLELATTYRTGARSAYEQRYTPEINYQILMDIYHRARTGAPAAGVVPKSAADSVAPADTPRILSLPVVQGVS